MSNEVVIRKLAWFKSSSGGEIELGEWAEDHKEYSRLSEWVEVSFNLLPVETRVAAQLDALNAQETEVRNRFQEALNRINDERGKLLALTNQAQPSV